MRWGVGGSSGTCGGEERNVHRGLVEKIEEKKPLRRS